MFIDTHCHLNFQAFTDDLAATIERAKQADVTQIIIPGAKLDSSERAVVIADQYDGCFAAVGIHPHHAETVVETAKSDLASLQALSLHPKVVAIGEIGLDRYHYKNSPPPSEATVTKQKEILIAQLNLAHARQLPVILHCREAQSDLLTLLQDYHQRTGHTVTGVFHCFDGTPEYLKTVVDLGFYIGFDGNSTYPANEHLRQLMQATPLDRLLLETDAPYLPPVPHRGKRNEPSYIPLLAQLVAEIHGKSVSTIAQITTNNATTLFHLP